MDIYIVAGLALIVGLWCGALIGFAISEKVAVENGHARFNEKTKKFEWKEIP